MFFLAITARAQAYGPHQFWRASDFPVEFTIDYQTKAVRGPKAFQPRPTSYRNIFIESEASKIIAAASPPFTRDDAPKVTRDLTIVSILAYLLDEQFDWQFNAVTYRTTMGEETLSEALSKPNECTNIRVAEVRAKLHAVKNMFADVARLGMRDTFCLPPHSKIEVTSNGVTLQSFICSISLSIREPFASMTTIDPHKVAAAVQSGLPIDASSETLPDGSPRYVTVVSGGRATVKFSALRSGDRDLPKYHAWAKRITEGIRMRFETPG